MSDSLAKLRTAMTPVDDPEPKMTLRTFILSRAADIQKALPAATGMTAERLSMVAYTLVRTTPKLAGCTPQSLLGALMVTAQLGLEPGPLQHVYFIPRWNKNVGADEVNFQIGYKGMIELARRAGVQVKTRDVYENDEFKISLGFDDTIVHEPALADRGAIRGFYMAATWADGRYVLWMPLEDIFAIRERSDSFKKGYGPWITDFNAMARKTVMRAAFSSNSIPTTTLIAQALNVDETVRTTIEAEALDITPERPDGTDHEAASVDQPALGDGSPPPRDGEGDGPAAGEGGEGRQEPGESAEADAVGSSGNSVDDGVVLSPNPQVEVEGPPESMPDDVDAAVSWLKSLTRPGLKEQARKYGSIVPKNLDDVEALEELARRVIEPKP